MKTFETEKGNIPEGATHYWDETLEDFFAWWDDANKLMLTTDGNGVWESVYDKSGNEPTPIPQTKIETPEEKEVFDSMKQSNDQSEINKPSWAKRSIGDSVTKTKGSSWTGKVVGYYSTSLTSKGYAVESSTESGSVQIYPEAALCSAEIEAERVERERANAIYDMCASADNFTEESNFWAGKFYDLGYRKES